MVCQTDILNNATRNNKATTMAICRYRVLVAIRRIVDANRDFYKREVQLMNNIVKLNRLKKIMDRWDELKPQIEKQEITNVCVVYMINDDTYVEIMGYEPTTEMIGMLDIAKGIVKEMV